jgi:predicted molibdopterin-dependent oxidoreductase YjgC
MNLATAKEKGLSSTDSVIVKQRLHETTLPLFIDERIPDACVYVPAGFAETATLGDSFGWIEIRAKGN